MDYLKLKLTVFFSHVKKKLCIQIYLDDLNTGTVKRLPVSLSQGFFVCYVFVYEIKNAIIPLNCL